ncbi:MAG: caspase family protein [Candidatus Marinimicrobia bacterium]|nr:caspase family protein [Candidatus Neomarinimicrobiota bacterium]
MKNYKNIICILGLFSALLAEVDSAMEVANEKFSFINSIYSESWALVIGINKYQNVEPLNYAVNDAIAVKDMLVDKYGFKDTNIKLITDEEATKDNILKGFSDILTQAKEKDRVVVFYAGHGETYKLPSGGDMGYLIPVDGNLDNLYLSSIPMKSVYDIADMSYAKHILYLVDACYGGLTLNTRGLKKDTTPEYIQKMTKERGRQVITAGGKDEQVIEKPEWGHSAFTRNLIKGLGDGLADENMDGIITGDELGGFIKNRVVVDVDGAHTPQKGRIGSDMGEFVFISETLDEQFADNTPGSEQLSDLESEMAEIKKLLKLQAQGRGESELLPKKSIPKNGKSYSPNKIKTASKLAWVFPGMGHYYTGRAGKGILFTGLEVISVAAYIGLSNDYERYSQEYQIALDNMDPEKNPSLKTDVDYENYKLEARRILSKKVSVQAGQIAAGTVAVGVWLWNIRDIKKMKSNNYSHENNFSVGVNRNGQIEARIRF